MNEAGQKVAIRLLYILKNEFVAAALEDITMRLPRYQANLKTMKDNGYEIVGYTQKSIDEKDDMKRMRLLNLMIEKLKTRSLVDKVFVSPKSSAGDPFDKRDEKKVSRADVCDKFRWRHSGQENSTGGYRLRRPDNKLSRLKKLLENEVKMYTSGELLNDEKKVKEFECRKSCIQRSK
ncbi:hypothetical protein RMATCC62417_14845 [Rhizopus microsporus]|nr:hypothetical protein RMATCC62417_14845 [Rhizopus microsporus]